MKKCQRCYKSGEIQYRVKSIKYYKWIFVCKKCWNTVSKQEKYSYGGTRKS